MAGGGTLREILAAFGFTVDTEELDKGKDKLEGFIDTVKGVGKAVSEAFAVEKVKEFIFSMAEAGEKLELQAQKLGTSTEALQEWQHAANMVGVNADQLTGAMTRLERASGGGGKGGGAGLAALGINAKDAEGKTKPVTMLMDEFADKIKNVDDVGKRATITQQVFGRSGANLLPLFEQGSAGIKKYRDEVKKLGGGMNEDFIKKSKAMLQESKRLSFAWTSFKVNVVSLVLPALTQLLEWFVMGAVWIIDLAKHTSILQTGLVALGIAAVIALSGMLGPLGAILLEMAPMILAFLVLEDFITFLRGGKSETGDAIDALFGKGKAKEFRKDIMNALQDVIDFFGALTGGSSAASERWREDFKLFRTQIVKDLGFVGSMFLWSIDLFTHGWSHMVDQLGAVWTIFVNLLNVGWKSWELGTFQIFRNVADAFGTFINGFMDLYIDVLKVIRAGYSALHLNDKADDISKSIKAVEDSKLDVGRGQRARAEYKGEKEALDAEIFDAADVISGAKKGKREQADYDAADAASMNAGAVPEGKGGKPKIDIHVNVPHGTSRETAEMAGKGAEEGVQRAHAASLIPGG